MFIIKVIYKILFLPPANIILLMLLLSFFLKKKNINQWKMLMVLTLMLYFVSIPLIGSTFIKTLEKRYTPPVEMEGDIILMLGGGATLNTPNLDGQGHLSSHASSRLLTTAQLENKLNIPVLITGGQVYKQTGNEGEIAKRILIQLGISEERILIENRSFNTSENAKFSKTILDANGLSKPILVTSAFHMHRSVLQFEKYGMEVIPYPTDYQTNTKRIITYNDFIPTTYGLNNFRTALKEYIGILAVKWY